MPRPKRRNTIIVFMGQPKKPRARRIPARLWVKHRAEITRIYESSTLDETRKFMAKERGFEAINRQYVHCFKKWGVGKYNTGNTKTRSDPSPGPSIDALAVPSAVDQRPSAGQAVVGSNPSLGFHTTRHLRVRQWIQEHPSEITGDPVHEASMTEQRSLSRYERELLAADFCFAISDDQAASTIFRTIYNNLKQQNTPPALAVQLAINSARCVHTDEQADRSRQQLNENLKYMSDSNNPVDHFLFYTLYARSFDSVAGKSRDNTSVSLVNGIAKDIVDRGRLERLPQRGLALDLVTYQCLHYVLVRYNEIVKGCVDVNGLLRQFLRQRDKREITCIRSCLQWCQDRLSRSPLRLGDAIFHNIPQNKDPAIKVYRADLEVFANLWHTWYTSPSSPPSTWDKTVQVELGISPTELLVTVVWMLSATSQGPVSAEGVSHLLTLDDDGLRAEFLKRFLATNTLVRTTPAEGTFRTVGLGCMRAFAERTLGVRIPSSRAPQVSEDLADAYGSPDRARQAWVQEMLGTPSSSEGSSESGTLSDDEETMVSGEW